MSAFTDYSLFIAYNLPSMFYTLLYGVYLVLFVICMYIMTHKKGSSISYQECGLNKRLKQKPSIVADIVLMLQGLALVEFITQVVQLSHYFTPDYTRNGAISGVVTLNQYTFKSFLIVNFFTNLFIPFMIAGRIWWIGRQISKLLPSMEINLTRYTMAICLESGIMYPLALLPALVLFFQPNKTLSSYIYFIPILIQVVGIAPTFIIVRVALGISIENVQDTICMNEENGQRDQVVLSVWEANHNIDEYVQKERSVV
ncbi:hypothetical protein K435DRAFT_801400 [Dendrothele bispora CBS 962.96]|uniref:Uncharacterized protein n=1 Tax=Dendrothele bispora (strain CBS 962.96) TaxID=1314807 RepID=A0A4V4HEI4_DENBC|nr:hypothetical protein K435DRAFT_801400 [Dendrothele bispora CBS 962.96]